MFHVNTTPLRWLSWIVWRLVPGRGATKMAEFSHTEYGSGLDMLSAVEETGRREMRRRYYRHALDELKHAEMFRKRAIALKQSTRAEAVLSDSGYLNDRGIRSADSLFSQMSEVEFLAFVWIHEKRGAQQFDIYAELMDEDEPTREMFRQISKDERFHIAYSRTALEHYSKDDSALVKKAIRKIQQQRLLQAWMRFAHGLGQVVTGLWLSLIYFLIIGPFSLLARLLESTPMGLEAVTVEESAVARAREMG